MWTSINFVVSFSLRPLFRWFCPVVWSTSEFNSPNKKMNHFICKKPDRSGVKAPWEFRSKYCKCQNGKECLQLVSTTISKFCWIILNIFLTSAPYVCSVWRHAGESSEQHPVDERPRDWPCHAPNIQNLPDPQSHIEPSWWPHGVTVAACVYALPYWDVCMDLCVCERACVCVCVSECGRDTGIVFAL